MDQKIVELDTYTYNAIIPDRVIEEYARFSDEEIKSICSSNPAYLQTLLEGISNYRQTQKENTYSIGKTKTKVYKKAGFMDVGMFVDLIVVSVAIIALILIILGTRY